MTEQIVVCQPINWLPIRIALGKSYLDDFMGFYWDYWIKGVPNFEVDLSFIL